MLHLGPHRLSHQGGRSRSHGLIYSLTAVVVAAADHNFVALVALVAVTVPEQVGRDGLNGVEHALVVLVVLLVVFFS